MVEHGKIVRKREADRERDEGGRNISIKIKV